ncbi:hypothetical protein RND71_011583 [Anisodus tanguticus]|uniref:P-type ATPase A domain-containing protein n=1 Tax=Anisodus tanguticus TaxID=243964 RepID=A0AAE1SF72_9SOLA|nr:hypothetical protein RND71_011583 [Anisodus tanguticus]
MEALRLSTSFTGINCSIYKSRRRLKVNRNIIFSSWKPKSSISIRSSTQFRGPIHCSHNHHDHSHDHDEGDAKLTKFQKVFLKFATAIRWTRLANLLRENLELCCCSAALFIAAGACPYFLPKPALLPLQRVFTLIAFPLVGVSASLDALVDITGGKINIHVLMALAAFASVFMGNILEGGLLLAMFNLAHIAEEYFTSRSKGDVKELKENHPEFALVLHVDNQTLPSFSDLTYSEVPVSDLEVDSFILVKAGEGLPEAAALPTKVYKVCVHSTLPRPHVVGFHWSIPVDCEVSRGRSTITIEHLTGEVKPLDKKEGDSIPGGARNLDGMLIVKAKKTWKESMLSRIVQLTEEAQLSKPKLQRWLDKFGEQYSKAVVLLSLSVAFLGPFLFKWPFFSTSACRGSIYRALGLMVAASPCALAVAPLAYATAISACAKRGILLKGGQVLDALASCHSIAFDKTGTLTTGEFMCKAIEPIHGHASTVGKEFASCCVRSCEKEALALAAAMERGTTHPIGRAVVDHSTGKDLPSVSVESFENLPGRGIFATFTSLEAYNTMTPAGTTTGETPERAREAVEMDSSEKSPMVLDDGRAGDLHGKGLLDMKPKVRYIADHGKAACAGDHLNVLVKLLHPRMIGLTFSITLNWALHMIPFYPGLGGGKPCKAFLGSVEYITSLFHSEDESRRVKEAVSTSSYGIDFVRAALSVNNQKVTLFHFEDKPRPGVLDVVQTLQNQAKLRVIMLTGDHEASAWRVAKAVGIKEVNCSLKPEDKLYHVTSISRDTGGLIMIKQNVALALCSIFVASLTSVMGFLPLWLTVLLHEGGTLLVCLNSVRALNPPTWSWREDISQIIDKLRSLIMFLRHGTLPSTIQTAHL